jgi:thioester reductase-like protein
MTSELQPNLSSNEHWLIELVAECLKVPAESINRSTPLARYGLDSLAAIQLTNRIATKLNRPVPDTLLLHYPSVDALELLLHSESSTDSLDYVVDNEESTALDRMLADSNLSPDIHSHGNKPSDSAASAILLTGATGFLGGYLLRALLRDTRATIYVLVRDDGANTMERVRMNLQQYGIWEPQFETRLSIVQGDLKKPQAGISERDYAFLALEIDEIYHCGANVNWVLPYEGLRDINVIGTRELLRFACVGKLKPFRFVSSIATCYTSSPLDKVTEKDEMLPYLKGLHLGYAQSKCVAESLVRRANERGLPATIFRPALITGDGHTGASNSEDLLSAMIRGCVAMGSAPNLDWSLDCCTVDYVADSMVALACKTTESWRVIHLSNPAPRRWQEFVLWMNLYGYPIKLLPYRDWLAQLRIAASRPAHPLYLLRSFFLTRPATTTGNLTLPELFEDHNRSAVSSTNSQDLLSRLAIDCPSLDAELLDRYFANYIRSGFLPKVTRRNSINSGDRFCPDAPFFRRVLRNYHADDSIDVSSVEALSGGSKESITTELAAWYSSQYAGLTNYRIGFTNQVANKSVDLFVKAKPTDHHVIAVAECVAGVCDSAVERAIARHRERLGILNCHTREIEVYRQSDRRFRDHTPKVYAAIDDTVKKEWLLVLESLSDLELLNSANDISGWRACHLEAAIRGVAKVHSIWYEREEELAAQRWLAPKRLAVEMVEMNDLWESLANYAWKFFSEWLDEDIRPVVQRWIADSGLWWRELEQMPNTLIHNDFNPRNLAFRREAEQLRLCAYDWELAAFGVPQHDLAELLCFVLKPSDSAEVIRHYIEMHRMELAVATGKEIDATHWRVGFQLSLRHLFLNRFAMYSLMHTFRPQAFLPRVMKTWQRLHQMFDL